jgi:hypothetical protein
MDKPTLLLGLAFFLASAPNPDSKAVAEMTANFIVPQHSYSLEAAETTNEPETVLSAAIREEAAANAAVDRNDEKDDLS